MIAATFNISGSLLGEATEAQNPKKSKTKKKIGGEEVTGRAFLDFITCGLLGTVLQSSALLSKGYGELSIPVGEGSRLTLVWLFLKGGKKPSLCPWYGVPRFDRVLLNGDRSLPDSSFVSSSPLPSASASRRASLPPKKITSEFIVPEGAFPEALRTPSEESFSCYYKYPSDSLSVRFFFGFSLSEVVHPFYFFQLIFFGFSFFNGFITPSD